MALARLPRSHENEPPVTIVPLEHSARAACALLIGPVSFLPPSLAKLRSDAGGDRVLGAFRRRLERLRFSHGLQ
jgi:hypothetical protein